MIVIVGDSVMELVDDGNELRVSDTVAEALRGAESVLVRVGFTEADAE